jgi:hypothetical protein
MTTTEKFVPECVQAAKLIRNDLKAAFPGIKFRVVTSRYSMGNSINVYWTDGPAYYVVTEMLAKYEDGDFDGMDDSYTYRPNPDNTPRTKYLFCNRELSAEATAAIEAKRFEKYGECFTSEYEKEKQAYEIQRSLSF